MSNWFRFYDDAVNDPKIIDLPDDLYRAWVNLLCVAAKNDGVLPEIKHVALVLRVKPAKAAALIARLVGAGLVDNHTGIFAPHNWQGRQFKSDDSGPRVKRHREKLRNAKRNAGCNVTVTEDSNAPEQKREEGEDKQSRGDASAPIDEDFKKREVGLRAGIGAMFQSRGWPSPNLDRVAFWLAHGYAAGTVLAAVEAVLKRGKPISTADYFDGAIKDAHAKAPPAGLQVISQKVFGEVGTLSWTCWCQWNRDNGRAPPMQRDTRIENVIKTGWWFDSEFPPGYDEATGERIAPPSDGEAAA